MRSRKERVVQIDVYGGDALAKVLHYYGQPTQDEKIVCPFHDDINPSMKIDYTNGKCYCFGCNESFDTLSFVKKAEEMKDDLKAMIKLAQILNTDKVKAIKARNVVRNRVEDKQALVIAHDYFYCLKTIDWSKERSAEQAYMKERGFKASTLKLCNAKYTYNVSYPLIFPIMDNDVFKGWVCRTTLKSIEKKRKYLYNEGFSRATTLCGTYQQGKVLVICEGYMDMLKFKQLGIKNVVAILGWKITSEQISKLKAAKIDTVISGLDTDEKGRQGTKYLESFFNVVRFEYPEGVKDAGDLTEEQFAVAFRKTKQKLKEFRRSKHGSDRRHQKSSKEKRYKQREVPVLQGRKQGEGKVPQRHGRRAQG